jgi:hypothetical protein
MRDAYYSESIGSWVRMERQEDGEWCHTSGFGSREAALAFDMGRFVDRSAKGKPLFGPSGLPSFLEEVDSPVPDLQSSLKKPRRKGR